MKIIQFFRSTTVKLIIKNTYIFIIVSLQRDCQNIMNNGDTNSGVYEIHPVGSSNKIQVYCDMDTDEGGWLLREAEEHGGFTKV